MIMQLLTIRLVQTDRGAVCLSDTFSGSLCPSGLVRGRDPQTLTLDRDR